MKIITGHALDLLEQETAAFDLIATDPPYAAGGSGGEHALTATVATVLREAARRLKKGGWIIVFCAASWRSTAYMVEAMRGLVEPVRFGFWGKDKARTKTRTSGWSWATVPVLACRKGKSTVEPSVELDYIVAPPVMNGRRAELPQSVADWAVKPFAVQGGLMLDPFAGSGTLCKAAELFGMDALGYEIKEAATA